MAQGGHAATIKPGYWVALTLVPDSAPQRVYVGQVEDVDERGVRITLIDWPIGMALSWDFFAPWSSIQSALVATPDHDVSKFAEHASQWQDEMSSKQGDERPQP